MIIKEILIGVAALSLIALAFIPLSLRIQGKVRERAVKNQLEAISAAGKMYLSEKGIKRIEYKILANDGVVPTLESVMGEKYDNIILDSEGGTVTVFTPEGKKISAKY